MEALTNVIFLVGIPVLGWWVGSQIGSILGERARHKDEGSK